MKIKILYEDSDIIVIDKPSGMAVHPDGKNKEETISDWFVKKYPEAKEVGEPLGDIARPGIVHRLDRETSGVLILAKNQEAHQFIKKQFKERKIKKVYVAIVSGHLNQPKDREYGVIDKPIGRSPSDFRRRLAGRGARGELREAITEYKVLKQFEDAKGNKFTLVEAFPKTGRTHQIRVHMKFMNFPVACDNLYAPKNPCPPNIGRLALHARSIVFQNPKGETIKVESPLPSEFANIIV
ncbi:MAG TPA: RluA family pseudouridine synthase [Candidatus Paceibacterota bacterium]|nr:RluA family pseudouridine synthase [Candidatus Paceibacterota bacterium]